MSQLSWKYIQNIIALFLLSGLDFEYQDKQNQHIYSICKDPVMSTKHVCGPDSSPPLLLPTLIHSCQTLIELEYVGPPQLYKITGSSGKELSDRCHSANNIFILILEDQTAITPWEMFQELCHVSCLFSSNIYIFETSCQSEFNRLEKVTCISWRSSGSSSKRKRLLQAHNTYCALWNIPTQKAQMSIVHFLWTEP